MRLFAGKLGMVCLLAGVLTLGEFGIQVMSRPAAVVPAQEKPDVPNGTGIWDTEAQMEAEYHRLEEEEEEKRMLLQDKEAELKAGEAGQTEVMELEEALRKVQLQKIVLKSRMDEKSFDK